MNNKPLTWGAAKGGSKLSILIIFLNCDLFHHIFNYRCDDLFKYEVLDIRFPVDNGEKAPDPSMRELVMGRVWKAMDEAGVWEAVTEAITKEVGWLCEGVCERIVESEDEVVAAAMAAVK